MMADKEYKESSKKCFNLCPNCGASNDDIEWHAKEWFDNQACQTATCNICGCDFSEYYTYSDTEWVKGGKDDDCPRIKCPHPYSEFFKYMDEIPTGTRVSTSEDCDKCEQEDLKFYKDCDQPHCLIHDCPGYPNGVNIEAVKWLLAAASGVLADFDNYGEVIQTDTEGEYGPTTSIEKLRKFAAMIEKQL
jgi:hypothetical protein